jgi:hypothetical protein
MGDSATCFMLMVINIFETGMISHFFVHTCFTNHTARAAVRLSA